MTHKHTILVVEDEASMLAGLEYALAKEGYDVKCAADGNAAIAEPSWLSPDGCRLYLTYGQQGGKTILHVATRPQ